MPALSVPRIDRDRVEDVADAMTVGAFGPCWRSSPRGARVVIGSRGTGYMDTWGLAGSGHIALFLLALGRPRPGRRPNSIGRWLRTGLLGVALGAFVLGLAWPYVVGPMGAGPERARLRVRADHATAGTVSLLVLRPAALPPDV